MLGITLKKIRVYQDIEEEDIEEEDIEEEVVLTGNEGIF